jgi:hypothetical protein
MVTGTGAGNPSPASRSTGEMRVIGECDKVSKKIATAPNNKAASKWGLHFVTLLSSCSDRDSDRKPSFLSYAIVASCTLLFGSSAIGR